MSCSASPIQPSGMRATVLAAPSGRLSEKVSNAGVTASGSDARVDAGPAGHVELERDSRPTALLDLLGHVLALADGASRDGDPGALGGERQRDTAAHALTRTGDQGDLAVEAARHAWALAA